MLFSEPKIPQSAGVADELVNPHLVSVLFSEPKIPQCYAVRQTQLDTALFQCSSASRKFLNSSAPSPRRAGTLRFSALQRAENSSMSSSRTTVVRVATVSVLFSEPKIPQCEVSHTPGRSQKGFSALQRAENSSIIRHPRCIASTTSGFSALQRAENSSIQQRQRLASRVARFSALQRAENSSIDRETKDYAVEYRVSVLFSEPKIPQFVKGATRSLWRKRVSVLFSEPKIPQFEEREGLELVQDVFQCSSASRKFLNLSSGKFAGFPRNVSVLFSEPKIPQSAYRLDFVLPRARFSALQRAENSSIRQPRTQTRTRLRVSVLFSEPKIPQSSPASSAGRMYACFSALQRAENSSM